MEWAIEECVRSGLPVAASMCIGPQAEWRPLTAPDSIRLKLCENDRGGIIILLMLAPKIDSFPAWNRNPPLCYKEMPQVLGALSCVFMAQGRCHDLNQSEHSIWKDLDQ